MLQATDRRPIAYIIAVAAVLIATLLTDALHPILVQPWLLVAAVVLTRWVGGWKPAVLAMSLSLFSIDFFFSSPIHSLTVSSFSDIIQLGLFVLVTTLSSFPVVNLSTQRDGKQSCPAESEKSCDILSNVVSDVLSDDRKQLELALQASESKLFRILNSAKGYIFILRVFADHTWNYEYCSPGCEQTLGYTAEELLADPDLWTARVLPEDLEAVIVPSYDSIFAGRSIDIEYRFLHKNGSLRWLLNSLSSTRDEAADCWLVTGVNIDITDRKRTEDALRRYERIVSTTPDGVALIDRNYLYQIVNQTYLARTNRTQDEIIGQTIAELNGSEVFETVIKPQFDRALVGEIVRYAEWFDYSPLERQFIQVTYAPYFDMDKTITGVVVTTRNLTDLKQAEDALQQLNEALEQRVQERTAELAQTNAALCSSKDLFEVMFEESADAIFLVDATTRLNLTCNQRAVELYEAASQQELIGIHGPTVLTKTPITPEELTAVRTSLATHGTWQGETEYLTRKGHTFWGSVACKQIQVAGESMILVRVTDISDRKAAAAALQISEQNLRIIFNNVSSHLLVHDMDGTLLDVNDRFLEFQGLEREQALKLSIVDCSAPDAPLHLLPDYWARVSAGETVHFEWKGKKPRDGTCFDAEVTLNQIVWNGKMVILANGQDVSDRKRAELEIRRNRDLFAAVFQEATDAILLTDPVSGRVVDCNQRVVDLFEADSRTELIGAAPHMRRKTPWTDAELVEVKRTLENQAVVKQECEYRTCKGRIFWGSVALKMIQVAERQMILARITDIDDRKQVELRLRHEAEADQLLATIAQTINQSIHLDTVLDTCLEQIRQFLQCDRVIVCRFDPAYNVVIELEAVSQPQFSLVGRTIVDPCFGQDWVARYQQGYITVRGDAQTDELAPCYAEFLAQLQVRANLVVSILQADQIWGLLIAHHCAAPRSWQPFEVDLFKQIGLQIGIAGQKATLYTQLENQLAQKEVLLKEVHHRVKNNLQVISSMLWLQAKAANQSIVFSALEDTRNRLQAMALIHETLYRSNDLGQINFHEYVQRLASSVLAAHSSHPNQINLTYCLQPAVFSLETAIPCGLLLNELVTNAIKHAFPNQRDGEVCITLEQLPPPVQAGEPSTSGQPSALPDEFADRRALPSASPRYALTIQDNGIGIPEALDPKKIKSLGLKIAYDLALQLHGSLELKRTGGTQFRLTFSALEYRKRF